LFTVLLQKDDKLRAEQQIPSTDNPMAMKITADILESYLQCKYKAHLKLANEQGIKSEYESLLLESSGSLLRLRRNNSQVIVIQGD